MAPRKVIKATKGPLANTTNENQPKVRRKSNSSTTSISKKDKLDESKKRSAKTLNPKNSKNSKEPPSKKFKNSQIEVQNDSSDEDEEESAATSVVSQMQIDLENDSNSEIEREDLVTELTLSEFLSSKCRIYHSNLLSTSFSPSSLERLKRKFREELRKSNGLPRAIKHRGIRVDIKLLGGLKQSKADGESLYIEIFILERKEDEDNYSAGTTKEKSVLRVLFTSCNSSGRSFRHLTLGREEGFVNLPLLLWTGLKSWWKALSPLLSLAFHTNFTLIHFSNVHMQLFTTIWILQDIKRYKKNALEGVRISYNFHGNEAERGKVDLELSGLKENFKTLVKDFESAPDRFKQILGNIWTEGLDKYAKKHKINLSKAVFTKISTHSCAISNLGSMTMCDNRGLDEILPILIQLTRIIELR